MDPIDVAIAGGAQTLRVAVDEEGVTPSNGAFWQQRLSRDEALRLAEALERQASRAFPQPEEDG